jgi:hypothetical protein
MDYVKNSYEGEGSSNEANQASEILMWLEKIKAYLIGNNLDKYVEGNGEYVNVDRNIFNELEGCVAKHITHISVKSDNHAVQEFFQVLSENYKTQAYGEESDIKIEVGYTATFEDQQRHLGHREL